MFRHVRSQSLTSKECKQVSFSLCGRCWNFRLMPHCFWFVCVILLLTFLSLRPQLSSILRIKVLKPSSYHEAKQAATEYHSAKQALIKAFHKAGLGAWVKKPIEQDQFTLSS